MVTTNNPLYPCGICKLEVQYGHDAIQCDHCDTWIHRDCAAVTNEMYQIYMNHSNLSWICIQCGLPNIGSSFFDSDHFHSANSFDILKDTSSIIDPDDFVPEDSSTPTKTQGQTKLPPKSKRITTPKLKTMVINCDGLKSEKSRVTFQAAVADHSPDLIIGCESKLDQSIPTYSIFPEDYNVIRKDRTQSGGGVFIAIKESLISVDKPEFDVPCEIIWSCLEFAKAGKVYIGSFYRPLVQALSQSPICMIVLPKLWLMLKTAAIQMC